MNVIITPLKVTVKNIFFVALLILAACATPLPLAKDISAGKTLLLPFRVDHIVLEDLRRDTTSEKMNLPVFSTHQQEWKKSPLLSQDLKDDVKKLVESGSFDDGLPVTVTVSINEAYYMIAGNARTVSETSFFQCTLTYKSLETNKIWITTGNYVNTYQGVFNAKEEHVSQTFKITAKNAVFTALKETEKLFGSE